MTSCASAPRAAPAVRQCGQVLALLLMLWAALLGGMLLVFNSGQIVSAKLRLVGAADAAAYSAAVWQARALNFQAYMNRGIVANEVAIAQLVSLRSWSTYMNQALQDAAFVSAAAPPVAAAMNELSQGWSTMNAGLQQALPLLEAAASHWNTEVLSRAEYVTDLQTPMVTASLAHDVAVANIPELGTDATSRAFDARNAVRWHGMTEGHGRSGEQRARLHSVVMASRDGFSQARGWTIGVPPLLTLRKRGGTDLIGYDSWRGLDTAALNVPLLLSAREHPMVWGAAENRLHAVEGVGYHGGSYRDNPRTSGIAVGALTPNNGYAGLPAYRDVRISRAGAEPSLRYEIQLREAGTTIATSNVVMGAPATVVAGEEPKILAPAFHSDSMYALSAAQVSFIRPVARADRRQELASLFNPYWEARLAPVTLAQRLLAAAARGGSPDPYLVLP
jgi:hypothetical protein